MVAPDAPVPERLPGAPPTAPERLPGAGAPPGVKNAVLRDILFNQWGVMTVRGNPRFTRRGVAAVGRALGGGGGLLLVTRSGVSVLGLRLPGFLRTCIALNTNTSSAGVSVTTLY